MKRLWLIASSLSFLGVVVILLWFTLIGPKPLIPDDVRQEVVSTIYVPDADFAVVDSESVKYDSANKLLSYNFAAYGAQAVMSQQPTPESFIDIPQVYDKVVANMNEYAKFDSNIGTVHLTRPKELAGKQTAVMNAKGTLMFVKPDRDLTEDQWRKLFNKLEVIK